MNTKRIFTLLGGLAAGLAYAFLAMLLVQQSHKAVSMAFVFMLPLVLGAIPVLFSTREQLQSYLKILLMPWVIVLTFFYLSFLSALEGMICLVVIVGPFLVLGSLGAFLFRLIKLRQKENQSPLYLSLTLPFLFLLVESHMVAEDYYQTVETQMLIDAPKARVWQHIRNVANIQPAEIEPHFVHLIGVPRPLGAQLTFEGVGAERRITWEKGIRFTEKITEWNEGTGFYYDIIVNPHSIPPKTLDEHVLVGGQYFDVTRGSYHLTEITPEQTQVTLTCRYRITTTLNWYSSLWANFMLSDFNQMILEVIRKRAEQGT
jgi:uncharacterized membrane protein (UPF0136 family)